MKSGFARFPGFRAALRLTILSAPLWVTGGCTSTMNSGFSPIVGESELFDLSDRPPTMQTFYAMSRVLIAQGNDRAGERILLGITRDEPLFTGAYRDLADLRARQGRYDEAIETLLAGLEVSPSDPVFLNNVGMCYLYKGDYPVAIHYFDQASDISPQDLRPQANKALAMGMMGRTEESFALYRQFMAPEAARHNMDVISKARRRLQNSQTEFNRGGLAQSLESMPAGKRRSSNNGDPSELKETRDDPWVASDQRATRSDSPGDTDFYDHSDHEESRKSVQDADKGQWQSSVRTPSPSQVIGALSSLDSSQKKREVGVEAMASDVSIDKRDENLNSSAINDGLQEPPRLRGSDDQPDTVSDQPALESHGELGSNTIFAMPMPVSGDTSAVEAQSGRAKKELNDFLLPTDSISTTGQGAVETQPVDFRPIDSRSASGFDLTADGSQAESETVDVGAVKPLDGTAPTVGEIRDALQNENNAEVFEPLTESDPVTQDVVRGPGAPTEVAASETASGEGQGETDTSDNLRRAQETFEPLAELELVSLFVAKGTGDAEGVGVTRGGGADEVEPIGMTSESLPNARVFESSEDTDPAAQMTADRPGGAVELAAIESAAGDARLEIDEHDTVRTESTIASLIDLDLVVQFVGVAAGASEDQLGSVTEAPSDQQTVRPMLESDSVAEDRAESRGHPARIAVVTTAGPSDKAALGVGTHDSPADKGAAETVIDSNPASHEGAERPSDPEEITAVEATAAPGKFELEDDVPMKSGRTDTLEPAVDFGLVAQFAKEGARGVAEIAALEPPSVESQQDGETRLRLESREAVEPMVDVDLLALFKPERAEGGAESVAVRTHEFEENQPETLASLTVENSIKPKADESEVFSAEQPSPSAVSMLTEPSGLDLAALETMASDLAQDHASKASDPESQQELTIIEAVPPVNEAQKRDLSSDSLIGAGTPGDDRSFPMEGRTSTHTRADQTGRSPAIRPREFAQRSSHGLLKKQDLGSREREWSREREFVEVFTRPTFEPLVEEVDSSQLKLDQSFGESSRAIELGQMAPEIDRLEFYGDNLKLSDYRGRVVVLNFWGHWSEISRRTYPVLRSLNRRLQDQPFAILGVNSDLYFDQIKHVLEEDQLDWPTWWDGCATGPTASRWGIRADLWPIIYVIDHNGVIRYRDRHGNGLEEAVDRLIEDVNAEHDDTK